MRVRLAECLFQYFKRTLRVFQRPVQVASVVKELTDVVANCGDYGPSACNMVA